MKPGDAWAPDWLKRGEELLALTSRTADEERELRELHERAGGLPPNANSAECCKAVAELFVRYGPDVVMLAARLLKR